MRWGDWNILANEKTCVFDECQRNCVSFFGTTKSTFTSIDYLFHCKFHESLHFQTRFYLQSNSKIKLLLIICRLLLGDVKTTNKNRSNSLCAINNDKPVFFTCSMQINIVFVVFAMQLTYRFPSILSGSALLYNIVKQKLFFFLHSCNSPWLSMWSEREMNLE